MDGSTSLTKVGNQFYLYNSSGAGPALKYAGANFVAGQFGGWTPIGAVQTANGYDVAWKVTGADEYTVWSTDSNGNYITNITATAVSGTDHSLESLESTFHQDLNGDGVIGFPATVIQVDGSTSLTEVANQFYLYNSSGSGPALKYAGANVAAGQFGGWTPIGAVQTANGYDVAWKIVGADEYTVWSTDSNGNYITNITATAVPGTDASLEALETTFHQDLNGDGVIGLVTTVVQVDGSTSLTKVANQFYLYNGSGIGPALKYAGADFVAGQFGAWTPIGAVQTANGYDVAWKVTGADEYTVWSTDSNGNYITNITATAVSGTDHSLESLESTFHQDLNGDGVIGFPATVIQVDGSTSLTEVANQFYLYNSSGSGPALKYAGANVAAGQFGGWTPIGAVQTANGYDVAWKIVGADEYTVWSTDSNGNYIASMTGYAVPGSDHSLQALETTFQQDLNRDGVLGVYAPSTFSLQYKGFDYISAFNGAYENSNSLPSLLQTGANSIEATLGYGIDVTTSQVVADPNYTDSLNALGNTIAQAESLGLSVMVKPVIGFLNPAVIAPYSFGEWRQDYQPANVAAFFASYKQMIIAEAKVAEQNGAQMLSIGAELDQLAGPQYLSYWTDIIGSVRAVFSGALTYSATWNTASQVSFWSQLNYEGIDCYVPLSNVQNPTLLDLVNSWLEPATPSNNPNAYAFIGNQSPIAYFENLAAQSGKPLLFTEVGYANDSGAAMDPSLSGNSPDPTLQAALYQAFFQAWALSGSPALKGAYFWEWDPNGSASHVGPGIDSFSPQNSPAQDQATAGFETQIHDGAIENISNIQVVGTLVVEFSTFTLFGTGTVTLAGGTIEGAASGETLQNAGNTILGTGTIGDGSGHLTLDNASGTIEASGGTLIVDTGTIINNAGTLEAATGATLRIDDPVTGTGGSQVIGTGATLEIAAADSQPVIFHDSTGTLILDHASTFSGQIFNFTGNGSPTGSDQIDLKDILFGPGTTASFTGNTNGGILTVTDAQNDTARISLAGNYEDSTFAISSDGNGGTLVVDPSATKELADGTFLFNASEAMGNSTATVSPQNGGSGYVGTFILGAADTADGHGSIAWHFKLDPDSIAQTITQSYDVTLAEPQPNGTSSSASQSVSVTVGGPGNDAFVFKPGFGADVIANTTSLHTIELDGFSAVTNINQLQTLLSEAQNAHAQPLFDTANSGHDTVINLGNHDSITLANVQLSDVHASNFIVHSNVFV